ncbi:hypothetical protein SSX86_019355 [Deinandra increscens subsp. villosa]|uniref:Glabrous enhancer-binding protein-like DBD domain-containing protein n=1 Tax=Deinandra increscens subsp. villosa TaxID=3103831 RepID=A0AAP0CZN3_9ASTR
MDFTPPSNPHPVPIQASPISSFPSSTKLPIKRKNPNSTLILTTPKLESSTPEDDDDDDHDHDVIPRQSPFKSHRIWTEPDEIRLLQGLLDCSSQGLSFPRDLGIFYAEFVNGMSQPYSKSQLSEKLRRLRKKFRVISSRISKGLDRSLLSPQDRALYDLSKQLWDPDPLSLGRNNSNCKPVDENKRKSNSNSNSVGVRVSFSPTTLPSSSTAVLALPSVVQKSSNRDNGDKTSKPGGGSRDDFNVNDDAIDVNVELVRNKFSVKRSIGDDLSSGIVNFATTTLAEVLDQSMKEMRVMIDLQRYSNLEKEISFEKRWREQHVAEFDVLAKRLKLIVERSSMFHCLPALFRFLVLPKLHSFEA